MNFTKAVTIVIASSSVLIVEMTMLHRPFKSIPIHEQADDDVVHLRQLGKGVFRQGDRIINFQQ